MKNFFLTCKEIRVEPSSPPSHYGCFYIGPFANGQALTVANALRRTLLSELSGLGITSLKIEGVSHEYSNVNGLRENVVDVLLNFKELVLKKTTPVILTQPQIGYLQARGPGAIRARDLKLPPVFQCIDPDQYLCTLNEKGTFNAVFTIEEGKNFLFRKNKEDFPNLKTNPNLDEVEVQGRFLPIDPVFSPIKRVNYNIQDYSSDTIYKSNQFVVLEIWTNGSVSPKSALSQTLSFLRFVFSELGKLEVLNTAYQTYLLSENPQARAAFRDLNRDLDIVDYQLYKKKLFLSRPRLRRFQNQDEHLKQLSSSLQFQNSQDGKFTEKTSITQLGLPFPLFKAFYQAKILDINDLQTLSKEELQKKLNLEQADFLELLELLTQKHGIIKDS